MEKSLRACAAISLLLAVSACNDIPETQSATDSVSGATTSGTPAATPVITPRTSLDIATTIPGDNSRTVEFKPVTNKTLKSWKWDFGDGNTASTALAKHSYEKDGIYSVKLTATDETGNKATASTDVTANAAPIAKFSGAPLPNLQISLDGGSSTDTAGGSIKRYDWNFGDGTEGSGITQTHRYAAAGTYSITLTITDDLGASATTTQQMTVTAAPVRIVAIGDSITQANRNTQSYRYQLWKKLVDKGVSFDLVGSQSSNSGGNPNWPAYKGKQFDRDHEGHWGWRADEILRNLDVWLKGYDADIALIHIGTNDLLQQANESATATASEISQIIAKLRRDNPRITILLANLIPYNGANYRLDQLNVKIRSLASSLNSGTSKVIFVDQNTGFYYNTDTRDGIHPSSPGGEEKMAKKWFDALNRIL